MSGWLRYFALNAQVRTGLSVAVLIWAIVGAAAAVGGAIFSSPPCSSGSHNFMAR